MSEKDNLQEADGTKDQKELQKQESEIDTLSSDNTSTEEKNEVAETEAAPNEAEESKVEAEADTDADADADQNKEEDQAIDEIEATNAKTAEKEEAKESIESEAIVEAKDYSSMSMDALLSEFKELLDSSKINRIKDQVESIRKEFNKKFGALLEEKKKEFLDEGGNSIDFRFDFPLKKEFNGLFKSFREKRKAYYDNLQKTLKTNLENRIEIIDDIKGLLNVEENINTTYKHFKALQERWRNAGPIPRDRYNNVWNNYHHHVENFYDFLHLNRDLRDLDFKHNLEQKTKIIERAEALANEEDAMRAFRELQTLHKIWKEELGPVAKEHRDEVWERFKNATKQIHEKRQSYFGKLDEVYQVNLVKKNEIIGQIEAISEQDIKNHSAWQKQIKVVEDLRQQFFNAGKVPLKSNEATWKKFKDTVRIFNRKKNAFYKSLKKDQFSNLQKKLDLIKVAQEHKDSTDFDMATPIMKRIQTEWKQIGHVPRKDSDKIWSQFKTACNHYFDRLHQERNSANEEETEAFNKKSEFLKDLKTVKFGDDKDANLATVKDKMDQWQQLGRVPRNKRNIESKFNTALDMLLKKLDLDKTQAELIKYDHKLEAMNMAENKRVLDNEHSFLRKKIDETESEINQLENNLQFFSNVDDDNPLVKEVVDKIDQHKNMLTVWRAKFDKIKKLY